MIAEEIRYCGECGSANKKSAVFCENCEKKLGTKHYAFLDYLKSHIKDELKDKATDKIYSIIKNYLLSHIYGTVLTVSIIAVATSVVYANYQPHIEVANQIPVVSQQAEESEEKEPFEFDDDDMTYLSHVVSNYDLLADFLRDYERYWETDGSYSSPAELYAEGNVDGYTYSGAHELYNSPVVIGKKTDESGASYMNFARYVVDETVVYGENLRTELGKKLHKEGFEVAEGDYYMVVYDRDVNWESWSWDKIPPADATEKLVYRMVFVQQDGVWYIAEDRLIERVGV